MCEANYNTSPMRSKNCKKIIPYRSTIFGTKEELVYANIFGGRQSSGFLWDGLSPNTGCERKGSSYQAQGVRKICKLIIIKY